MPALRPPRPPPVPGPRRPLLSPQAAFRARPDGEGRQAPPGTTRHPRPPAAAALSPPSRRAVLLLRRMMQGGQAAPWPIPCPLPSPRPESFEGCAAPGGEQALRALRAAAALGLPGEHRLVRALEEEARRRLGGFGPEDVALLLRSALRLHPPPCAPPAPLLDGCLHRLEALLEGQEEDGDGGGRPWALRGVLPLLLWGYRRRGQPSAEIVRRLLRLVLRRLEEAESVPEPEWAAMDEVLAWCAPEAGEETLGALFRSAPFSQHVHPLLLRSLAGCFPNKVEKCTPATVAALAGYLARHRLREPPLLDSIAAFLLHRVEHLDIKVIQRLVFPFSRMSYPPSNHLELFPSLAAVLQQRAAAAPLATLNILMSLFQLCYFPAPVLHHVFSQAFVANVSSSPCGWIAQNYLSLLDAAVQLELSNYSGPRLEPRCRVSKFHKALTADGTHCSYKGLVWRALQQLVGKEGYLRETVVPPGYSIDFLLWISSSGRVFPIGWAASAAAAAAATPQQKPLARHRGGDIPSQERPSSGSADPGSPAWTTFLQSGGAVTCAHLSFPAQEGIVAEGPQEAEEIHRVVLCVNDKWHYCRDTLVLVGSRAMRNRHLSLLGYRLVQLPYLELEQLRGLEEAKQYLCQKMREQGLPCLALDQPPGKGKEDNMPRG